jgi:hypothetical protein
MKNVITLLFVCSLVTKVFAGPSISMGYNNHTQNLYFSASVTAMTVPANAGDSVSLSVYINCGTWLMAPYYWMYNGFKYPILLILSILL